MQDFYLRRKGGYAPAGNGEHQYENGSKNGCGRMLTIVSLCGGRAGEPEAGENGEGEWCHGIDGVCHVTETGGLDCKVSEVAGAVGEALHGTGCDGGF